MAHTWYVAAVLVLALGAQAASADDALRGRATVLDGDTLVVRGKVIGLGGVVAPRSTQTCETAGGQKYPCGKIAAEALANRIGDTGVACAIGQADPHGRTLGTCRKDGEDLAAWLVSHGYAVADRHVATDYVPNQKQAWAKRRGLWAGVFEDPTTHERQAYSAKSYVVDADPADPATTAAIPAPVKRKR
jgi:endonuclease YncB( thermonuclease family)